MARGDHFGDSSPRGRFLVELRQPDAVIDGSGARVACTWSERLWRLQGEEESDIEVYSLIATKEVRR